ncbi:MAG: hypothetical protein ACI8PZ_001287 [Myxococcota bacterium]|jgi:hypothetical protein
MLASVRLQGPDGQHHHLLPGDLIGRLRSAALPLNGVGKLGLRLHDGDVVEDRT